MSIDFDNGEQRRIAGQRMRRYGSERISSADTLGHFPYNDVWNTSFASPYGNPEVALIEQEEGGPRELDGGRRLGKRHELVEVSLLWGYLEDDDRMMMLARSHGVLQKNVAVTMDRAQPSIWARETRVKAWMEFALWGRLILRNVADPPAWKEHPERKAVWDAIVWGHKTTVDVARTLGHPQSTLYGWWKAALKDVLASASPAVAEVVQEIAENLSTWHKPNPPTRTEAAKAAARKIHGG